MGSVLAGKYRLERELGRGGMGAVIAARHEQLAQRVAIKVLLPEYASSPDVVARFVREARAAANLESEHVVRVTDVGLDDRVGAYMAMEYLEGSDLAHALRERGPFPVKEAVDCVLEAIDALAEAHSRGIVHRDVKPANLFLATRKGGTQTIKVLDFGISKVALVGDGSDEKLTATGQMLGSPGYMSPEQIRASRDVDARADIWSLGAVLFELLGNTRPFDGETVGVVFANVLAQDPKPLRSVRKDAPEGLAAIVRRCLDRDAAARYADVGELAKALAPFGSGRAEKEVRRASAVLRSSPARAVASSSSSSSSSSARRPAVAIVVGALFVAAIGTAAFAKLRGDRTLKASPDVPAAITTASAAASAPIAPASSSSHDVPVISISELPQPTPARAHTTAPHGAHPAASSSQPSFLDRQR